MRSDVMKLERPPVDRINLIDCRWSSGAPHELRLHTIQHPEYHLKQVA